MGHKLYFYKVILHVQSVSILKKLSALDRSFFVISVAQSKDFYQKKWGLHRLLKNIIYIFYVR